LPYYPVLERPKHFSPYFLMKKHLKKALLLSCLSVLVFSIFSFEQPRERYFEIAKNLDIFATLFKEVNTYYVDEVNPGRLIKVGIDAMLESLDPYTNYIPEDEIEDFRTMTTGQYGGIGAVIGRRKDAPVILMPYLGWPAEKAGLKIGDEILDIDGVNVKEKSTSDISKLLKGQYNTTVKVTIRRFGTEKPFQVELIREKIKIDAVPYYGMITDKVGYFQLTDFTSAASKEVKKALMALKEKGAQSAIFDLRDNPGGLLSEAINISNLFIPKQSPVVSTRGKVEEWNKTYTALNAPFDTEIPIVVLTSDRSASASEIVAGVLQDYDRAVVVGEKSYGKGLVQATRPLSYNSQVKITTAKYYTPSGRCIQAIDYSQRNEEGDVTKIPDSLRSEFKTKNGRKVFDGGGITPDIKVDDVKLSPITISLIQKGLIFDFATEFAFKHKTIKSAKEFKLSDAEYLVFVEWLKDKDYDYITKVESTIDDLISNAKSEKYFDAIKSQIEELKVNMSHNKEKDLITFRSEIIDQLEEEIASRYYFQHGKIEASFDNDADIQAAMNVLTDPIKLKSILSGK